MKRIIHKAIVWYLKKVRESFHTGAYGDDGRYVVLMTEVEYHQFMHKIRP